MQSVLMARGLIEQQRMDGKHVTVREGAASNLAVSRRVSRSR